MNNYMHLGDIVILDNIVFNDEEKNVADHASLHGRPCIYIGEKEEIMYFFALTGVRNKIELADMVIIANNQNKLKKDSEINMRSIIKKPYSFYKVESSLEKEQILKMIKIYFKNNYKNDNPDVKIILNIITEYINDFKKNLNYIKRK